MGKDIGEPLAHRHMKAHQENAASRPRINEIKIGVARNSFKVSVILTSFPVSFAPKYDAISTPIVKNGNATPIVPIVSPFSIAERLAAE